MMRWRTRTHLNAMPRRGIAKRRLDGVCTIMQSSPLSRTKISAAPYGEADIL